ncbi:aspartic peptidase domain-containing protein [Vararia minispora EC-137]|uniref:Aspartic peptidase domain-containing protein n=1 Tax=Vararia minispora EC-137 TaxID=1314806 RepID=A0ACB8Q6J9_9AGAM|nr:aspartic peptidase domain-containing protein [Vararia minispora EC-137]
MRSGSLLTFLFLLFTSAALGLPTRSGVSIALMRRSNVTSQDGSVNASLIRVHVNEVQAKITRGMLAYEFNTGTKHHLDTGLSRRAALEGFPTTNGTPGEGIVLVGSPSAMFTVDFDTGVSDLILPGVNCNTPACTGHPRRYNPVFSLASEPKNAAFITKFGGTSVVSGTIFTDAVSLGGLVVKNQALGAADSYPESLAIEHSPQDGIMGLAFPSISRLREGAKPVATPPFLSNLIAQGSLLSPVFGVKLAFPGAEIFLGGVNTALSPGPVTPPLPAFWEVVMDSVSVAGTPIRTAIPSIIDTGSDYIVGDSKTVNAIFRAIPGSKAAPPQLVGPGFFTTPCGQDPKVSLTFGKRKFLLPASALNLGPIEPGSQDCLSGIVVDTTTPGAAFVVGEVFLKTVYTSTCPS